MEIPEQFKQLYKHWSLHANREDLPIYQAPAQQKEYYQAIITFVNERLRILSNKESCVPKPWTTDPILSAFRFCNIYREFDRQTVFFHTLLQPLEHDFPLWLLNMLFCRSICRPETIAAIGLHDGSTTTGTLLMQKLLELPSPKYGTAYIFPISVIQRSPWNTREKFFCQYYPIVYREIAEALSSFSRAPVTKALHLLLPIFGFPLKFLMTEVLIDVAYQYPEKIDLFGGFPVGPGAKPTLQRFASKNNVDLEKIVLDLSTHSHPDIELFTFNGEAIPLSTENWEGICCEYRKYSNLSNGTGRRRHYNQKTSIKRTTGR